jgi:orotate phosphoribosyltransferase
MGAVLINGEKPIMKANRNRLWQILNDNSLITGQNMTLSTGTHSSFYFDCKKTTLTGEALNLVADVFLEEIDKLPEQPIAIGGLTMGADFIVSAVVMRAYQVGHPTVNGSIVRKEPKKHGTRNHIENDLPAGTTIAVVDDVITTGGSTAQACDRLLGEGYKIVGIIALVDREAGGAETLSDRYRCPVRSVFAKSDFPRIAAQEEHQNDSFRGIAVSA